MIDPDLDAEYLKAAANRIRILEAENASFADDLNEAIARITALKTALREIAEGSFVSGTIYDGIRIARAALAPEQDK
jgi:hypothetical protein